MRIRPRTPSAAYRTVAAALIAAVWVGIAGAETPQFGPPTPLNTTAAVDTGIDWFHSVATDEAGNWVAVWEHAEPAGSAPGHGYFEGDIFVARSSDNGVTWSVPASIYPVPALDESFDAAPTVATDGGGTWIAVWRSFTVTGTTVSDQEILTARSTDGGATWTVPAPLNSDFASDGNRDDTVPQVTTDGAGTWVAVWQAHGTGGYRIWTARSTDAGVTWSTPAPLAADAFGDSPRIATDGLSWVVVWERQTVADVDVFVARSTDGGASWSTPSALNSNAAVDVDYDMGPQVATDGAGQWVAVWTLVPAPPADPDVPVDSDVLVARSTDGGATWSAPALLNTNGAVDSGDDGEPFVTADGMGTWIAAWTSYDTLGGTLPAGYGNILQARSQDGGATWTAPAPLNGDAYFDECRYRAYGGALLGTDGAGVALAVWFGLSKDCPVDYGIDGDLFFARASTACGNAVIDAGEDCDDGGLAAGDGCDPSCHVEPPPGDCGNGVHEQGEECDDGNTRFDDGCDPSCHFDPPPSVCGDGVVAPDEQCDDGNVIPGDGCDDGCLREPLPSLTCGNGVVDAGEDCDDGGLAAGDGCDPGCHFEPCHPTPDPGCRGAVSAKSSLKMRRDASNPFKSRLDWKWRGVDATSTDDFGSPVVASYYSLCVYDGGSLVSTTRISGGGTCAGKPCWRASASGFTFKDKLLADDGAAQLVLKSGAAGKPALRFSGRGVNLEMPALPVAGPVTVQLRRSNGPDCWSSAFSAPFRASDGATFSDAAD